MKDCVRLGLAGLFLTVTACGGGGSSSEAAGEEVEPSATSGGDEVAAGGGGSVWADMSRQERFAYMQDTVMPEMQAMFQEHDPERFAEFGCATCHGDDAEAVGFEMPNGVAPLDPNAIPAMFESDQPMAQFMTQRVWPRMADLLDEPPYDMETGEGFSCLRCHAMAEGG